MEENGETHLMHKLKRRMLMNRIKRAGMFEFVILFAVALSIALTAFAQQSTKPQTVTLFKRTIVNGVDNYTQAAFSFKYGINGDAALPLTRNNWDVVFEDSALPDAFDVHMVADDCSRIKDLNALNWSDAFEVPLLPAYDKPTDEPSVKAIVGHMYLVHTKDRDNDHYALFRMETLNPGESVTITWKLIPAPEKKTRSELCAPQQLLRMRARADQGNRWAD